MYSIKIWAENLALILIVTGIVMKTVSSKSERLIIRLVVIMILIVSVFQVNLSPDNFYSLKIDVEDFSYKEEEIIGEIENKTVISVENKFRELISEYDNSSSFETDISDNVIIIKLNKSKLSDDELTEIENEMSEYFSCEVLIERGE